jgi:hypothetical protein
MKRLLASAGFLLLLSHCGSSGGTTPNDAGSNPDGGSGFTLNINDFDNWCTVTVGGNPASLVFPPGTVVSLDAVAHATFVFHYWLGTDGANSGNNGLDPNASTTVTMTGDKDVLACCDNATERCPTSL